MPQPIDNSPPWWDGTIAIPFTRDEWISIISCIEYTIHYSAVYPDECLEELNIIDRIQKNIDVE